MSFHKISEEGVSIITVNLKHATTKESGEFKKLVNSEVDNGVKHIIIDMNECEYIDSTFLGVILAAFKKTTAVGGDIRLVGFKASAQSVMDITGTSRIFKIYPSIKQALSSFSTAA